MSGLEQCFAVRRPRGGSEVVPKWSRSWPELVLSGLERCFAVRRPRGGSEVLPKWSRSGPELVLSGPERCFAVSGWAESGPEIVVPKWPRAGFERSGAVFCCLGVVLKRPRSGWPSQNHSELHLEGYLEVTVVSPQVPKVVVKG